MSSSTSNNSTFSSSSSVSPCHINGNFIASASESRRQVSSPWTQIVRGESEPTISAPSSSSQSNDPIHPIASVTVPPHGSAAEVESSGSQGNAGKRPVWNSPSNRPSEVGRVMGASSWPALSEASKFANNNNKSSDSLKSLGEGPSPSSSSSGHVSQGFANAYAGRGYLNPTPNHSRQRSSKWNAGPSGSSANGAYRSPANGAYGSSANGAYRSPANGASGSTANGASGSPANGASRSSANGTYGSTANGASGSQPSGQGSFAEVPLHNSFPRGQNQRNGNGNNNNISQRGNQNGNHGRRNHEQGNPNLNFNRNSNGRDANSHSQRGTPPAIVRYPPPPPPPPAPLPMQQPIHPPFMFQTIPPYGSQLHFHPDFGPMYHPRMPSFIPPAQVFYHQQYLPLHIKIQKQIHYYFCEENLDKDKFLRSQMNEQGFVPLHIIAGFNKMTELKVSIQQIVEALQGSPFVEVQGDGIRKRHNWQNWVPPRQVIPAVANPPQPVVALANQVGNLSIGHSSANSSGGSSSQVQPVESQNNAVSDGQQQQPI